MPLAPWESPEALAEVLASLAAQSWPARCLVVSVDGALPPPLRRVLEQSGLPLRILEAPGWQGTGAVLARGLAGCSTDWVLRADADDCSHPERAERQLRYVQAHPDVVVLGAQLAEAAAGACRSRVRHVPVNNRGIRALMRWRNPLNHPTVALRRQAVLAFGNYRPCPGFEDWDLWLRLAAYGSTFANLPDALVTAAVGEAHLARRRGGRYLQQEARFLMRCGSEGLLPLTHVWLLMALRLPWRLLPPGCLAALMAWLRSAR